jgi:hypothetical protein
VTIPPGQHRTDGATFERACRAIEEVVPRFAELVRRNPGMTAKAVGSWTLPEVACHVSHVIKKDTDALTRRELPFVELSPQSVAVWTKAMLADDPERDVTVLADRINALGSVFLELRAEPPTEPVTWVGGTQLTPSAVACHLLEELLVHGYDVAKAARARWHIEAAHAALAIVGAVLPIIAASPESWLSRSYDPRVPARVEFRLRGFQRYAMVLDDGLHVEIPPTTSSADAHVSADPAQLLLVMLGRQSPWRALRSGKVIAWGRRPQALLRLLHSTSSP